MGIKIVPTLSKEEKRKQDERKSLISRLEGLSSEELKSMIKRMDERAANEMELKTPTGSFRSGGSVKGRPATSSAEKS